MVSARLLRVGANIGPGELPIRVWVPTGRGIPPNIFSCNRSRSWRVECPKAEIRYANGELRDRLRASVDRLTVVAEESWLLIMICSIPVKQYDHQSNNFRIEYV